MSKQERAVELYLAGESARGISQALGISLKTLYDVLATREIPLRRPSAPEGMDVRARTAADLYVSGLATNKCLARAGCGSASLVRELQRRGAPVRTRGAIRPSPLRAKKTTGLEPEEILQALVWLSRGSSAEEVAKAQDVPLRLIEERLFRYSPIIERLALAETGKELADVKDEALALLRSNNVLH